MTNTLRTLKNFPLTAQIIIAMFLGGLAGIFFGPQVTAFGVLGKLIIQLIKAIAVPLVFFAIIDALLSTRIRGRSALHLLMIVAINASIAATIGLTLSNLIKPGAALNFIEMAKTVHGESLQPFSQQKLEFSTILTGYIPVSFITPFHENNIIGVIILALLVGISGRVVVQRLRANGRSFPLEDGVYLFMKMFEQMMVWLVHLVPLAVFGVMCKTVGEYGFAPFKGLALYVIVGSIGLTLQCIIVYPLWIRFFRGIPISTFWREAKRPLIYAFGTNSSLATLPLTLKALDNLKISKAASRLGACVGTNLNNDGILLYEAMAVLFVAQAHGIVLPLGQQIATALLCVVAAIGVAGVPEAGVVSLAIVLTTVGLPLEILPLLLTVDWLIARLRSVTNVMSDMTVSIALDRWAVAAEEND